MSVNVDDVKEMKKGIKDILHILNGNGKIGLCAKVNILWSLSIFIFGTVGALVIKIFIFPAR